MNAVMEPTAQDARNGLHWLRAELDLSLARVRDHIDQSLEREDDELLLQKCIVELHQIRGIATVAQCYGAACLADAMKTAVQALANGDEVRDREAAITALLGASVQFSDYLDLLTSGAHDALLVFHPMINELRVSCGLGVLSEADLVTRHVFESGALPLDAADGASPDASVSQAARKLLPALHKAMRRWVRGEERTDSLKRVGRIAEHLRGLSADSGFGVLMQATAATVECLLALKLSDSLELKRQFGQVGEWTKRVAVTGEQGDDAPAMVRAAVRLGVEVYRSGATSKRARDLVTRLRLDDCLVPDAQLEQMRISIRGPNTEVLTRVANEIREDFAQVKDEIDLAIRTGQRAPEQHESMARTLKRVSDTLTMLDLGSSTVRPTCSTRWRWTPVMRAGWNSRRPCCWSNTTLKTRCLATCVATTVSAETRRRCSPNHRLSGWTIAKVRRRHCASRWSTCRSSRIRSASTSHVVSRGC